MATIIELGIAIISFMGVLIAVLSGVIAWLSRKIWQIKTNDVPSLDERVSDIESIIIGVEEDQTDQGMRVEVDKRFSNLEDKLDSLNENISEAEERRREEHREVRRALIKVIEVLDRHESINGDLPDKEDL